MIVKAVLLFLLFMAVMGLIGKWRFPGATRLAEAKCPDCGRFRIGKGPCACKQGRP